MDNTTKERQRRFRERLYKAGFKQVIVWIKRKERKKTKKTSMAEFTRQLKKLTSGMSREHLACLLNLLIKITRGRTEEAKLKKKK